MKHSLAPLRPAHCSGRRAFTLIEILVVIAIIGILSAILFPVFSRARENGRAKVCLSNMKQLGLAFQQYAQDSRQKYPLGANFQAFAPGYAHWIAGEASANGSLVSVELPASATATINKPTFKNAANVQGGALFPYVKSTKVYTCPSAEYNTDIGLSYSMNCAVSGISTTRVRAPSDIVLLVDEQYPTDGWFYARDYCPGASGCSTDTLQSKHNGGGNLLFVDGHVKFYPNDTFKLDYSPEGLANKARMTGAPRFHDRAFGSPKGSSLVPFQNKKGEYATGVDACLAETTPTTTTPNTPGT